MTSVSIDAIGGVAAVSGCCNLDPAAAGSIDVSGTSSDASTDLPVVAQPICVAGAATDPDSDPFPTGTITFFDRLDCPSGWAPYATGDGRMLVPMSDGATPGNAVGTALASGEARSHAHDYSGGFDVPQNQVAAISGGNNAPGRNGTYDLIDTTDATDAALPYVQALVCEKQATAGTPLVPTADVPSGSLAFYEASACPSGWTPAIAEKGRFIVGRMSGVSAGQTNGSAALAAGEDRTHVHDLSGDVTVPGHELAIANGCCYSQTGRMGAHAYAFATDPGSSGVPFVELLGCVKN
jgi:hypothetical protein